MEALLEMASCTDPGMVRPHNEDSLASDVACGFAVLADGMGGYSAGEIASGIAVTMIGDGLRKAISESGNIERASGGGMSDAGRLLKNEAERANAAIYQTAQAQPRCAGMGTTLVMAMFHDNCITTAHVGDSRLYRLRDDQLTQITRDHSLLQEQIDSGLISPEEARHSSNKNLVTRAMGVDPEVEVDIQEVEARPGDIYLFCSDGLNDMVEDEDIRMTLSIMGTNLPLAAQQLVQMANDNGGRDNVSVILVRILKEYPAPRGWFSRFFGWIG